MIYNISVVYTHISIMYTYFDCMSFCKGKGSACWEYMHRYALALMDAIFTDEEMGTCCFSVGKINKAAPSRRDIEGTDKALCLLTIA